jgi:hypothetical protein
MQPHLDALPDLRDARRPNCQITRTFIVFRLLANLGKVFQ